MQTVAIVGVGLIGGSFGLALRHSGFSGDLIGVSSRAAIESGLRVGAITRSATLQEAAAAADLIYLSQPVDRILQTIEKLGSVKLPGTLITDAGSTKQAIVAKAAQYLPSAHFIGGHPMAGKERRGPEAADSHLFRGRPYILTPHLPETDASQGLKSALVGIGARLVEMSPEEHDSTVALTSHLPQILSTALAVTLARSANARSEEVFGPGLLDMTRLAASSPDLWIPILQTNKARISAALDRYSQALMDLHIALNSDTLVELFETGTDWAKRIRQTKPGSG